jgi:hypothetical protein
MIWSLAQYVGRGLPYCEGWGDSKCSWLLPSDTSEAQVKGTTMWVSARRGGNVGKPIRPEYRILDIRPKQQASGFGYTLLKSH